MNFKHRTLNVKHRMSKFHQLSKSLKETIFASSRLRVRHSVSSVLVFLSFFILHSSLFLLLLMQQTLASASIQMESIDLGALPVAKATSMTVNLSFSGDSEWITGVESSCSCLGIDSFPKTMKKGDNYFDITFIPNDSGPAEVDLTIFGLNAQSGEQTSHRIPVSVIGFKAAEPNQLHSQIQSIRPSVLYSQLERYAIIDLRGSESYRHAHIPGSFEYTLDALVARLDRFKKPLVLVSDGLLSDRESRLLEKMSESGLLSLFWLEGGLPIWMRAGLPVQGVWPSTVGAATISLQRWLDSGGASSNWEVVDLTGGAQTQNSFFGHSVHLYESGKDSDLESFLREVQESAAQSPNSSGILIIGDSRGLAYPVIEHSRAVSHDLPVYYLNQGDAAVSGWLASVRNENSSSTQSYVYSSDGNAVFRSSGGLRPRTGRKSGCSSCPGR